MIIRSTMVENRIKHRQNSHLIIHCPTSEGVSEVSERASKRVSAGKGASEASSPEQAIEWVVRVNERTSERTSEWPSTQCVSSWIIRPTVWRRRRRRKRRRKRLFLWRLSVSPWERCLEGRGHRGRRVPPRKCNRRTPDAFPTEKKDVQKRLLLYGSEQPDVGTFASTEEGRSKVSSAEQSNEWAVRAN